MSDIDGMIRARQVQDEALAEINSRIKSCQESMRNYEQLSTRITTLPDKLTHQVMVPFGKLAFMPGRLVHTNELLVHLGDTWFASMTCKQALKIVETRQKNLQDSLTDLEKVSGNIQKKSQYLGEIKDAAEGGEFEIKEECPESYTHPKDRRRISKVQGSKQDAKASTKDQKNVKSSEQDELMARLDELERLEEEEDELYRLSDNPVKSDESLDSDDSSSSQEAPTTKHVRFKDDDAQKNLESCTIRFKHSKVPVKKIDELTPADVHKIIQRQPKSILKPTVYNAKQSTVTEEGSNNRLGTAVSDFVFEKSTFTEHERNPPQTASSSKPISKFKAGRMKR